MVTILSTVLPHPCPVCGGVRSKVCPNLPVNHEISAQAITPCFPIHPCFLTLGLGLETRLQPHSPCSGYLNLLLTIYRIQGSSSAPVSLSFPVYEVGI